MFLFFKSVTCAVYLRELIIFTLIFYIVAINQYKIIKSIDKSLAENYRRKIQTKLQVVYPLYDKPVWRYCNNIDYKIKDRLNIVTSKTERRIASTALAQVITVIAEVVMKLF